MKDKNKFQACQYNRIHIFPLHEIEFHQSICPDREDIKKLTAQLKETLSEADRERQRSREKVKRED